MNKFNDEKIWRWNKMAKITDPFMVTILKKQLFRYLDKLVELISWVGNGKLVKKGKMGSSLHTACRMG